MHAKCMSTPTTKVDLTRKNFNSNLWVICWPGYFQNWIKCQNIIFSRMLKIFHGRNTLVYIQDISCPNAGQYLCVCAGRSNIVNAKAGHFSCRESQLTSIWPISACHDRTPEKCNLGPEISYYVYDFYAQSEISPQERFFPNKHSDTYQPWIRLAPILFLFCDRQYLYIGETEKSLQKGFLFKTVSANSDGRGRTFVKVVYQKFNGQFTLACGPAVLDT